MGVSCECFVVAVLSREVDDEGMGVIIWGHSVNLCGCGGEDSVGDKGGGSLGLSNHLLDVT
jgi:hypothetical protein